MQLININPSFIAIKKYLRKFAAVRVAISLTQFAALRVNHPLFAEKYFF